MEIKSIKELQSYVFENSLEHLFNVVVGAICGWGADYGAHKFLEKVFHYLGQHYVPKVGDGPVPAFEDIVPYARLFGVCVAAAVLLVLERQSFIFHLQRQILSAVKQLPEPEKVRLFDRFFDIIERVLLRFDPVDERTVRYMKQQLPRARDTFAAITQVPARRWFAGENYLTILLLQVHALITVKPQPTNLQIFRIIVWPDRNFFQDQSIALLRVLFSLKGDFNIPLETFLMTKAKFKAITCKFPDLGNIFKDKKQFWVCTVVEDGSTSVPCMVWGKRRPFKTEESRLSKDNAECSACAQALTFLKQWSVELESVFGRIDIFDDGAAKDNLRRALSAHMGSAVPKSFP